MRTLSPALTAKQKESHYIPLVSLILFTKAGEEYKWYRNVGVPGKEARILGVEHAESPSSHTAEMLLQNFDGEFNDLNLEGYWASISYGCSTTGELTQEYSSTPPLWIVGQQMYSAEGVLVCALTLAGLPNRLREDKASEKYVLESDDTQTVKTLIRKIVGDTGVSILDAYDHCDHYDIVFDSEDDLIDSYKPKESFAIPEGADRLTKIDELLAYTACVKRYEVDNKIHIFKPTTTGDSYDYEYQLLVEGEHTFFNKTIRKRLVIPNYIVVRSLESQLDDEGEEVSYSGSAEHSQELEFKAFYRFRVDSNGDCDDLAAAILARSMLDAERGHGRVPMNVGAEVFDYVKITDSRQSDSVTGNIGYIKRHYQPGTLEMEFGFGKLTLLGMLGAMSPSGSGDAAALRSYIQQLYELVDQLADIVRDIANYIGKTIVLGVAGTLAVGNNASFEVAVPQNLKCKTVFINVKTAPTGASLIVDVNLDGTTIFTTQSRRPTIAAGATTAPSGTPNVQSFTKNQILSIDIDQVGSTVAGADLIVEIRC